jgi:hypothetical protein
MPSPSRREKIGTTYDEGDKDKVTSFEFAMFLARIYHSN